MKITFESPHEEELVHSILHSLELKHLTKAEYQLFIMSLKKALSETPEASPDTLCSTAESWKNSDCWNEEVQE
ncbi:hypothetical protein [Alteribacillus sp. HJP-4]|uniref:hypothetical protein n=1 Tax=Alteribacillus sp. HJP-4 TaxID=2775394 RepID=UPI0035CD2A43